MFGFGRDSNAAAALRKNREACHRARDAYYACIDRQRPNSEDRVVSAECRKLRKAFEGSCKATWVRHFDKLREREARIAQELQRTIDATASSAKGATAGQSQQ